MAKIVADQTSECRLIRARDVLTEHIAGTDVSRDQLQTEGLLVEERTEGAWLRDYIADHRDPEGRCVVDSGRTPRQVSKVLETDHLAKLVYLEASPETRLRRFISGAATDPVKRSMSFDQAMRHSTEIGVGQLVELADLIVDTEELLAEDVAMAIKSWAGWAG